MFQVIEDNIIRNIATGRTKVSACPEATPPVHLILAQKMLVVPCGLNDPWHAAQTEKQRCSEVSRQTCAHDLSKAHH